MDEPMHATAMSGARPVCPVKIIVESRYDAALYGLLCGDPIESGIEFASPEFDESGSDAPRSNRGGYRSVSRACRIARSSERHGQLILGLLDGEEAARFGRGCELFEDPRLVFSMTDPDADGLLFLGSYEKENLYLRYGDALGMMQSRFNLGLRIGGPEETRIDIQEAFDASIKASVVKYAAKAVIAAHGSRFDAEVINVIEDRVFKAIGKNLFGTFNPSAMMREAVAAWSKAELADEFIERMKLLSRLGGFDVSSAITMAMSKPKLLSLCDGAAMLQLVLRRDLKHIYEDMATNLLDFDFGSQLRVALLSAARGRADHAAPNERDTFSNREPLAFRLWDRWRV